MNKFSMDLAHNGGIPSKDSPQGIPKSHASPSRVKK